MLRRLLTACAAGAAGAAAARAVQARRRQQAPARQPLTPEPDRLPNEPVRPAGTTAAPTGRATPGSGPNGAAA